MTAPKKADAIVKELRKIAKSHGGILQAEAVVEYARSPMTALHSRFTWEESAAAHQYRLWQARQVIRVSVQHSPALGRSVRVFVSLTPDRDEEGGGYRDMDVVVRNRDQRDQMLADALAELEVFRAKYAMLKELAAVMTAIKKTVAKK
jgi:hypothetical protein